MIAYDCLIRNAFFDMLCLLIYIQTEKETEAKKQEAKERKGSVSNKWTNIVYKFDWYTM